MTFTISLGTRRGQTSVHRSSTNVSTSDNDDDDNDDNETMTKGHRWSRNKGNDLRDGWGEKRLLFVSDAQK